jgi:hypothetical protein
MTDASGSGAWLKWLSVIILLLAGLVGLGVSLCGGVFLLGSLGGGSDGLGGIAPLAGTALVVGLVVLIASIRQLISVLREPAGGGRVIPAGVRRAAVLTTIDFVLSGMWFFLPLVVSLLRRRTWARPLICVVLALKWLSAIGFVSVLYAAGAYLAFGGVALILDAAVVVTLFSGEVSAWFAEGNDANR